MSADIELREGFYYGPWRAPANPMRESTGNTHSEETARGLGFRGGLVASSIHMETFPPLLNPAYAYPRGRQAEAIGLYGAIELRNVDGPFLVGKTYRAGGRLMHVGDTPKTEFLWFDSWVEGGGRRAAEMRMMLRYLKASSPLYQETSARATA